MKKGNDEKNIRRRRRNDGAIEADIMQAGKEMVEQLGFQSITIRGLIQQAEVEPNVFYKRFADLDDFFEHFTRTYDYWLGDIVDYKAEVADPYYSLEKLLEGLVPALYGNRSMQRLLIWELSEDNPTTRRTAQQREDTARSLLEKANELLSGKDIDIAAISALLIGGVYYLILHSGRSTFSGIDFSTDQGKERLQQVTKHLISAVRRYEQQRDEARQIAQRMRQRGIDPQTIYECTGVTI